MSHDTGRKRVIERTYQANVQELWELWTTKEGFESWWAPEGFRADVSFMEPQLDGEFRYEMIAVAPEMVAAMKAMGRPNSHQTRGRFSEFKIHERVTLTHVIDFLPGVPTYESVIEVEFHPVTGGVRMVVTLHPMHDEETTQMSAEGFASQLSKLDQRFALLT